jgi:hypothetical protein
LEHLFDPHDPRDLVQIHIRATDDLPNHVKQDIFWSEADSEFPTGYYLTNRWTNINRQVEFVDHYWHYIFRYHGNSFTLLVDHIDCHTEGTGNWAIQDPQHEAYSVDYWSPTPVEWIPTPIEQIPTLVISIQIPGLSIGEDPELSPFVTALPWHTEESSSLGNSSEQPEEEESSPEQLAPAVPSPAQLSPQEQHELTAVFQQVLDIEEREPEDPNSLECPAYLQLVQQAAAYGLNIPAPPPIAVPQPIVQAWVSIAGWAPWMPIPPLQAAPAAPQYQTGKLRGTEPDIFYGDRSKSEVFKQQFTTFQGLNNWHEVMEIPYYRTMQVLSLIKGPMVNNWVTNQVQILRNRVNHLTNPVEWEQEVY